MTKSLHSCLPSHVKHFLYELGVVQSSHRPARHTSNEHWGLVCCYLPKICCADGNREIQKSSLTLCQPTHLNVNIMNISGWIKFSHCYYTATLFFLFAKVKSCLFYHCLFSSGCCLHQHIVLHDTRALFFWNSIRQVFKISTHFRWSPLKSLPIKSKKNCKFGGSARTWRTATIIQTKCTALRRRRSVEKNKPKKNKKTKIKEWP